MKLCPKCKKNERLPNQSYCETCWNEYQKQYSKTDKRKEQIRRYATKLRETAIAKLGGKCVYCGCDDTEALEFNHINGGGYKEGARGYSKSLLLDICKERRKDIELTCRICNAWHFLTKIKGVHDRWKIEWNE
jgi:hypothetical protein